jgi:hypothetical protein
VQCPRQSGYISKIALVSNAATALVIATDSLLALEELRQSGWIAINDRGEVLNDRGEVFNFCAGATFDACNWLVHQPFDNKYCFGLSPQWHCA